MDWENWMNILRCPVCREELLFGQTHFACFPCQKTFPLHFGIPDFRLLPPDDSGYMSKEEDLIVSAELFDLHEKLPFEELARIKISREADYLKIDKNLQDLYIQWRLDNHPRAMGLTQWIQDQGIVNTEQANHTLGLDIGCGSGSGMATLLEIADTAVGFDLTISSLILAKSFLEQFYPDRNYLLFAGVAEYMPLASEVASLVLARDVIEHVADQTRFLKEAHRVMCTGGSFLFNTGSRFVLIEPHTRLPFVGYLPRLLQPLYVRLVRSSKYKVHLPSLWELRRWLTESPFNDTWKIVASKRIDLKDKSRIKHGRIRHLILGILSKLKLLKILNGLLAHLSYYEIIIEK